MACETLCDLPPPPPSTVFFSTHQAPVMLTLICLKLSKLTGLRAFALAIPLVGNILFHHLGYMTGFFSFKSQPQCDLFREGSLLLIPISLK